MLMPTDIDQQFGRTFIELTKWMNNLRGFNIQNEAPYITTVSYTHLTLPTTPYV